MFKVLIPAAAALGLIAFSAQSQVVQTGVDTAPADPVMGWSLHHEGTLAKLAYGVANSDQLALMVTCEPGDVGAIVYGDVRPQGARVLKAMHDPLSSGEAEETRLALADPALTGLATRGRMTVVGDGGVFQLAATYQERGMVRGFLSYCGAERA